MEISSGKLKRNLQELLETKNFVEHISVDCAIFGFHQTRLKILLLKYPELDRWSLPGGFVFEDEDLDAAAERVLFERTEMTNLFLKQFYTFGGINRNDNNVHQILLKNKGIEMPKTHWIFQRFVTVGYCSLVDFTQAATFPDSFNEECRWFDVEHLPTMAFDHETIIEKGIEFLRTGVEPLEVAQHLMPEKFTMNELQKMHEVILNESFRRNNFQRKILSMSILERLEKLFDGSANKAPYLYRFHAKP